MTTQRMRIEPLPEPDPREAKLPAWAREQMARCRRIAAESQRAALDARLATNPDSSGAVLDYHGEVPVGLGERPEITFKVPDSRDRFRYITVRQALHNPKCLEIRGAEPLVIRPGGSNTITVELER